MNDPYGAPALKVVSLVTLAYAIATVPAQAGTRRAYAPSPYTVRTEVGIPSSYFYQQAPDALVQPDAILQDFEQKLLNGMQDLPSDIQTAISDHLWDLL
jgi:hypothetical protein